MKRLEKFFRIDGLRPDFYVAKAEWENARFYQDEDGAGFLHLISDPLRSKDELDQAHKALDATVRKFVLAHELECGKKLELRTDKDDVVPDFSNKNEGMYFISRAGASSFMRFEMVFRPAPVPVSMPEVPLEAERWIKTYVEAADFEPYPDEQIKRYYLIIEEFKDELDVLFSSDERPGAERLKNRFSIFRNFASHAICNDAKVVRMVSEVFPDAVHSNNDGKCVIFDRINGRHRGVIAGVGVEAGRFTENLIRRKIKQIAESGSR